MLKGKQWIYSLLIVAAFFVFEHRSTPTLPFPPTGQKVDGGVQIPVKPEIIRVTDEAWNLSIGGGTYYVNVYNNKKMVHQFASGKTTLSDTSGTNYATSGTVTFDGTPYQATTIHINPDHHSGYILFTTGNAKR